MFEDMTLSVSNGLVPEVGKIVIHGSGGDKAHRLPLAGRAEEALAFTEHDRVDHQPQLVVQVVLD
jgi:hypothetical protein